MENTNSNLQRKSTSQLVEMVGSGVLLICLFLPWVTTQLGGRSTFGMSIGTSFSFFDGIGQLNLVGRFLPGTNYLVLLYFVPLLCIINPIVQYFKRLPWLSYYTAWIPVSVGLVLSYGAMKESGTFGGYGSVGIGAGAVLSLIVGLIMQCSAWTAIGIHFKEHSTYFYTVLAWFIVGLGISLVLAGSTDTDLWMRHLEGCIAWGIFASIGLSHFFFLIYGGIVALASDSPSNSSTPRQGSHSVTEKKTDEYLDKARTRTDEELKVILQHKEDYNERLVRAAKLVILERVAAVPASESSEPSAPTASVVETEDDKYKAYQPSAYTPVIREKREEEKETPSPEPTKKDIDSFAVVKKEWQRERAEESRSVTDISKRQKASPAAGSSRNGYAVLYSVLAGVWLAVGGALLYFLWYTPYVKDRDALRTYVIANNVFLRSSRQTGVEHNIIDKVPYGSEVITYSNLGEWAEVKVNGQEGFIASAYLLDKPYFTLLEGIWGNDDAKEYVESAKCRLAIFDYFKRNHLPSGQNGWLLETKPVNQKSNTVFYPRIYDKYSKFTDFMFIIGNPLTDNRVLVCYSFDDTTEKPIFRFDMEAPSNGFIQNVVPTRGGVRVIFDNKKYLDVSL